MVLRRNRLTACRVGEMDSPVRPSVSSSDASSYVTSSVTVVGVASSVKTNPRIEPGVRKVREQVEQDHRARDDDHPRHDLGEVTVRECGEEVPAGARVLEGELGDHQSAE